VNRDDAAAVVELVARGFEGEAEEAAEAFADGAELQDQAGEDVVHGRDGIEAFFLDYGGRRARFVVRDLVVEGTRAAVAYDLWFRSDSTAYAQHGMALVRFENGLVTSWRGVWAQTSDNDLSPWGGD
jgi:hypothetical protein